MTGLDNEDEVEEYFEKQKDDFEKLRKDQENLFKEANEQKIKDEIDEREKINKKITDDRLKDGIIRRNKLRQYLAAVQNQRLNEAEEKELKIKEENEKKRKRKEAKKERRLLLESNNLTMTFDDFNFQDNNEVLIRCQLKEEERELYEMRNIEEEQYIMLRRQLETVEMEHEDIRSLLRETIDFRIIEGNKRKLILLADLYKPVYHINFENERVKLPEITLRSPMQPESTSRMSTFSRDGIFSRSIYTNKLQKEKTEKENRRMTPDNNYNLNNNLQFGGTLGSEYVFEIEKSLQNNKKFRAEQSVPPNCKLLFKL